MRLSIKESSRLSIKESSRLSWLAALWLALTPALAGAQDEDSGDEWYRVELLILANRDPETALSERWPLLPELAYPERRQFLEPEPLIVDGAREFRLVTIEDTLPTPLFDLMWERSVDELWRDYRDKQLLRVPSVELEELVEFQVPRQRVLLPAEQREFNAQRGRIESSAGLEVLFHQAWLQRIDSREASLPLVIDGSSRFGDYPELQGSILLYSGRYLHIATNLWLNTGGNYLDIDPTTAGWRMPRPPLPVTPEPELETSFRLDIAPDWLGPIAAIAPAPELEEQAGATYPEDLEAPIQDDALRGSEIIAEAVTVDAFEEADEFEEVDEDSLELDEDSLELEKDSLELEKDSHELDKDSEEPEGDARSHEPVSDEALAAFLAEPVHDYEFRHAVLLQQSRRMRSGELHYIDHPLVGIVVKVNRHEFEPFIAPENPELASAR